MRYSEMPRSRHRSTLIKWSKMITAEAETSEKFPKGAMKTILPKYIYICLEESSWEPVGKNPGAPGSWISPSVAEGCELLCPMCCSGKFPRPVTHLGTTCAPVPGQDVPGSVVPAAGFWAGELWSLRLALGSCQHRAGGRVHLCPISRLLGQVFCREQEKAGNVNFRYVCLSVSGFWSSKILGNIVLLYVILLWCVH